MSTSGCHFEQDWVLTDTDTVHRPVQYHSGALRAYSGYMWLSLRPVLSHHSGALQFVPFIRFGVAQVNILGVTQAGAAPIRGLTCRCIWRTLRPVQYHSGALLVHEDLQCILDRRTCWDSGWTLRPVLSHHPGALPDMHISQKSNHPNWASRAVQIGPLVHFLGALGCLWDAK